MSRSVSKMRMYLTVSCLAVAAAMHAPALHAETVNDAVLAALQKHPSVEAAVESLNAAKQNRKEQFSSYFPELSITGQTGRMFGDNSTSRGLVTTRGEAYSYIHEGTVTLRQPIFDGLETPNRVDAAEARRKSAYNNVFEVREDLALRAVQSYLNVMRAREGVAMLHEHRKKVSDYLARIKNMLNEGAADETEYQQALDVQVILDGILADFEGQLMAAEAQYAEAVGRMPGADLHKPAIDPAFLPPQAEEAAQYALEHHPTVIEAQHDSRAASYDINAEKAALYPDLNGELSYLKSDKRDEIGGEAEDARAVLRMSWNFSTGGAQLARIKRSQHTHKESLARIREIEREVGRDVQLAYSEYVTAAKQLELLQKRKELNETLFKTYTAQFEGARVKLLQLMQSDNQLFNTKLETMNGLYRQLSAEYGVLASMGRLQAALNMEKEGMPPPRRPNNDEAPEADQKAEAVPQSGPTPETSHAAMQPASKAALQEQEEKIAAAPLANNIISEPLTAAQPQKSAPAPANLPQAKTAPAPQKKSSGPLLTGSLLTAPVDKEHDKAFKVMRDADLINEKQASQTSFKAMRLLTDG